MADRPSAPENFKASKTTAKPGESITFTWDAVTFTGMTNYQLFGFNPVSGEYVGEEDMPGHNVISASAASYTCTYPSYAETYILYYIQAQANTSDGRVNGEPSEQIKIYADISSGGDTPEPPEPPTPPAPTVSGRLEQFQNSAGGQIFPRTIIEGIFRQSDGKTLAEILDLYAPKADPVFTGSISMGRKAGTEIGKESFAAGLDAEASGQCSHAEGFECTASETCSHAEGSVCVASGDCSHAEGLYCQASGRVAHAEGWNCKASGNCSHSEGVFCEATGAAAHAGGCGTVAAGIAQTVIGGPNVPSAEEKDAFIIGNGGFDWDTVTSRSNCFRVTRNDGVYANSSYNSSGADYAEMFDWADGNPDGEDRAGRFVTLDGAKIRLAEPGDDYILGIVSGNPSVVGDVYDDQWQGMYLSDIFGRPIWENAECFNHTERRQKLNPDYDSTQKYTPRSARPEWDAVGVLGKLVAVDDGTCQVNGWCAVGAGGIATASENRTKYRVMERLDENHVRVMIL